VLSAIQQDRYKETSDNYQRYLKNHNSYGIEKGLVEKRIVKYPDIIIEADKIPYIYRHSIPICKTDKKRIQNREKMKSRIEKHKGP
jgi:hypothetical protein